MNDINYRPSALYTEDERSAFMEGLKDLARARSHWSEGDTLPVCQVPPPLLDEADEAVDPVEAREDAAIVTSAKRIEPRDGPTHASASDPSAMTDNSIELLLDEILSGPVEWRDVSFDEEATLSYAPDLMDDDINAALEIVGPEVVTQPVEEPTHPPTATVVPTGSERLRMLLDAGLEALLDRNLNEARDNFTRILDIEPEHRLARANLDRLTAIGR